MSVTLQSYREVAQQAALKNKDLCVTRDAATDRLRVSVNNPLRRAIAWLRGKISKSFRDQVARGYREFFAALGADAGPESARGARQLLARDLRAAKPLSARHITRVMDRVSAWKLSAQTKDALREGGLSSEPAAGTADNPPPQAAAGAAAVAADTGITAPDEPDADEVNFDEMDDDEFIEYLNSKKDEPLPNDLLYTTVFDLDLDDDD